MKKKFYHYNHNHPIGIFFAASILFASGTSFLRANLFDVNGPEKQFGLENNATYNWWSSEVWADTTSINDGSNPTGYWQGDSSQSENAYFIGSGGSSDIYLVRLGDTGNVDTYVANIGLNIDAAGQGALPAAVGNVTIGNIGDTGKLIFGINSSVGAANGTLRINNGISLGSSSLNYRGGSSVIAGVISGNVNSGISLGGGEFGLDTGSLVLSGNNSFEGSTSVASSYLLSLRHANALGVSGGSNIVHSGGTMEVAGGVTIGAGESVSIAGDGSAYFGALRAGVGGGTWAGNVILASTGFIGSRVGATDGNTLTITGSIINGAGNNITVSGQNGNGVVILNPTTSNAYTGNTNIVRGILRIGKSNALPVGTTLNIDYIDGIAEAATFDMAGFHQTVAGLTNSALSEINGKVTNSIAATTSILTVDNSISGSYFGSIEDGNGTVAFVKNGSGSFTLGGVNTYTGTTTVNGGMLQISNASAIGGNEVRVNGGQIAMNGGITVSGKSIVISGSGTNFLGGLQSISGSNQWAGSVTLGADLSRIGAMKNASLVVSGGIGDGSDNFSLVIRNENQSSVNDGAGNASTITELSGANSYDGNTQLIHGLTKLAGGDNRLPTSTIIQFGNEAGANAKFDMNGRNQEIAGLRVMNQSNSITRDWNSNELTNSSATLSTLTVNTASNQDFGLTTTTFSGSSNYTGIITGNVALVKSGLARLTLTSQNTYTGNTNIARGILRLGESNALPVGTTLNIDSISGIEEAATFDMAGFHQTVAGLTNSALSEINGKVTNSIAATTSILTVENSISSSYFGSIEDGNGTVAFVKNGSGSFTLGGVNTYTGTTTVNGGMLQISNASAIGGNEVRVNGGQIAMNGGITVSGKSIVISGSGTNFLGGLQSISGSNQWAGSVTLGADLSRIGAMKNASLVVSGGIGDGSDYFSLVIRNENQSSVNNGAGNASTITELSGANSYDGNTQLIHGLTKLAGGDNRLPTSTIIQFGNEAGANAKFDMNGRNQEIGGLRVMNQSNSITRDWNSNELTNSSATLSTLTVNTASNQDFGLTTTTFSGSSNYTGIITGNVALVKSGLARLTLTSQNTYTGNTTIEGGTLALEAGGSISTSSTIDILASSTLDVSALGNWSLAGGQTLKGIGTVDAGGNNSVTISSGAILAPGFSPGTLLVNGNLSLASGSTYVAELKNSGVLAADLVNIYGDFTIVSGAVLNLQLFDSDAPLADGTKYSIFSYKGNWNNQIFNGYADDSVFTVGLNQFRINYNDTIAGVNGGAYSNFVTLTAVPESNTVLLGSFCVIFLFGRKRKHS